MPMWLCRAGRYGEFENKFLEDGKPLPGWAMSNCFWRDYFGNLSSIPKIWSTYADITDSWHGDTVGILLGKKRGYYTEQAFTWSPSKLYWICRNAWVLSFYSSKSLQKLLWLSFYADAGLEGTKKNAGCECHVLLMKPNGALIICRAFLPASSVRVLPGRNLLVGTKSPIPKIRTLFWQRICKMLLCRSKTKPFSTLTEFAMFEKSIAYECCYMIWCSWLEKRFWTERRFLWKTKGGQLWLTFPN